MKCIAFFSDLERVLLAKPYKFVSIKTGQILNSSKVFQSVQAIAKIQSLIGPSAKRLITQEQAKFLSDEINDHLSLTHIHQEPFILNDRLAQELLFGAKIESYD
ncbi:MAG: hypothetical protein SFT81_01005 [Candidatus Caenarcaniphilales bacterium]|nr:hypothetical protein [Candidatus Caenarcaniphilales bacterium]